MIIYNILYILYIIYNISFSLECYIYYILYNIYNIKIFNTFFSQTSALPDSGNCDL